MVALLFIAYIAMHIGRLGITIAARTKAILGFKGPRSRRQTHALVEEECPARGLHLIHGKSLLFIPNDGDSSHNALPSDIHTTMEGFNLLGSPIGPPSFCEATMLKRVEKVKAALSRLPDLEDSQLETTLLRSCLALPKVASPSDAARQATSRRPSLSSMS